MLEFVKNILIALNMPVTDLHIGYFSALSVVMLTLLGLLIIRITLKIVFRKRRCHTINIKSDNGDALISSSAIMAVIKALEKEFSSFTINKVNLFRYRKKPFLEVHLDFDASKGGLPSHAERFKLRVIESLDALFGIKNIKKVHLHLHHVQLNDAEILKTEKMVFEKPAKKVVSEKSLRTAEISVGNMKLPAKKQKKTSAETKEAPIEADVKTVK